MNYIKYFLIFSLSLLLMACGEDFVTKEYQNGVVDENFFQTAKDAEQALTAVYDIVGQKGYYRDAIFPLGESSSDNIDEQTGDNGDFGFHYKAISDYRWVPDNPFFTARWYDSYRGIFRANILLEKLPDIAMEEDIKQRYAAEAKFLRGLYYFTLIISYGDVPLVTEVLTRDEYNNLTRVDQSLVYAQVEQDLMEAVDALPVSVGDASEVGRATKGSALGLLSRVYLYQKKWQESADASEEVVGLNKYNLVEDYGSMFSGRNENSEESLFEMQSVSRAPGFWNAESENLYSVMWSPMIGWANWYTPSVDVIQAFEEGDRRRKASLLLVGANDSIDLNGDGVLDPFPDPEVGSNTVFFTNSNVRKFLPEGKPLNDVNNYDINFPIIRYAEILLNYAEALNELNRSAEALGPLNEVRSRAELPAINTTDQGALREIIYHERRIELVFEGHRFFDLKRQERAPEVLGPLGFQPGVNEYFPIPQEELDLNPNLTQYPE
ncbi:MAG: RagB/SusD family nutrient uptake outer membrane protein [Cyclobacteriaceae bacterium]